MKGEYYRDRNRNIKWKRNKYLSGKKILLKNLKIIIVKIIKSFLKNMQLF